MSDSSGSGETSLFPESDESDESDESGGFPDG